VFALVFNGHRQRVVMQLNQRSQIRPDFVRTFKTGKTSRFYFFVIWNIRAFSVMLEIAIAADGKLLKL